MPLTVEVDPEPSTTCTFTAANSTVALPSTPADTYVGASTAVLLDAHDGEDPVPPDRTASPAVFGMHSHPGVTAAQAAEHAQPQTAATSAATTPCPHISRLLSSRVPPHAERSRAEP